MGRFTHTMPVRFADVDHAGIVYYPIFYHYFHVAFEELLRQRMGASAYLDLLDRERIGFPAVSSQCDYKAPLRFGDTVEVDVSVARLGDRSVQFAYQAFRAGSGGERTLAADGRVTCAVVDLDEFRAVAIPDRVRALFLELS